MAALHLLSYLFLFLVSQLLAGIAAFTWIGIARPELSFDKATQLPLKDYAVEMFTCLFFVEIVILLVLWKYGVFSRKHLRNTFRLPQWLWAMASVLLLAQGLEWISSPLQLSDFGIGAAFEAVRWQVFCVLGLAVLGPIFEEVLMREGIQQTFRRVGCAPWLAVLLTAATFGLIHANPYQAFAATVAGIYLGIFRERSGTLLLPIAGHILNNSFAVLQLHFPALRVGETIFAELSTAATLSAGIALTALSLCCLWQACRPSQS